MKILLIASLLCTAAFADNDFTGQKIDEVKSKITANIDQKISQLQAHKSCVQSASSHEDLKKCRENHKSEMKKLHEENKVEREAMKKEWKSKGEEMRAKRKERMKK